MIKDLTVYDTHFIDEKSFMQKKIKSYVLRAGRISKRQMHALDVLLDDYTLNSKAPQWDFTQIFGRDADTIVEIGFGMGRSLFSMAQAMPEKNFIGIEVHQAGVGSLLADLHEHQIENVKIVMADAVEVFQQHIANQSLAGIQIFFPDPWPKKKHHKRRLIQKDFTRLLADKLRNGGFLHCATDWENYAEHMLEVLHQESSLVNTAADDGFLPRPETRPATKFEKRGIALGHKVWDLIFEKQVI